MPAFSTSSTLNTCCSTGNGGDTSGRGFVGTVVWLNTDCGGSLVVYTGTGTGTFSSLHSRYLNSIHNHEFLLTGMYICINII